jgi:hypothetical protein
MKKKTEGRKYLFITNHENLRGQWKLRQIQLKHCYFKGPLMLYKNRHRTQTNWNSVGFLGQKRRRRRFHLSVVFCL